MSYRYIERAYGKTFKPGQRVRFTELNNSFGVVKRVQGDPQYVRVKFDNGSEGDCHPDALEFENAS